MIQAENLTDTLYECFDLEYLSDLRFKERERKIIGRILPYFAEDTFDAAEWSDALTYLYGAPLRFMTVQQAQAFVRRNPLEINTPRRIVINGTHLNVEPVARGKEETD